jgi:hypothetical protein
VEQKKKAEQAKIEAKLEAQRREQEKLEKAKVPPSEYFRVMKDKYPYLFFILYSLFFRIEINSDE